MNTGRLWPSLQAGLSLDVSIPYKSFSVPMNARHRLQVMTASHQP